MTDHQPVRMTTTVRIVLGALRDGHADDLWGMRIIELTKLHSGTVYPILTRLEDHGWVEGRWEDEQPAGRPRRRYWRLTTWGAWRTREVLGRADSPDTEEGDSDA